MEFLAQRLIKWYHLNRRNLPWRNTKDPYKIWISEIILQQTRVNQGINYYFRFIEAFPEIKVLAQASQDEVLKLWQGLGYYSRARNMHEAARQIERNHKSVFPQNYNDIRALKGVGDYTAAAIASFAFNLRYAVVDGNVYRVISRVFGVELPINSGTGKKYFQKLANELLPKTDYATFNQSIMEFGALQCKPNNPNCGECVLNDKCLAYAGRLVDCFPVKSKAVKSKNRFFNYFVITQGKYIYISKRSGNDIWKGLFEFYLVETGKKQTLEKICRTDKLAGLLKKQMMKSQFQVKEYIHVLSHRKLHASFFRVEVKALPVSFKLKKIKISDLDNFAWPRLIEKFLNEHKLI